MIRLMDISTLLGTDVLLFFVIGLLGGAHCIGMCGPLVTVYAGRMREGSERADGGAPTAGATDTRRGSHLTTYEVRQHALFNLGRAASYATIGAALGALGGAVLVTTATVTGAAEAVRGVVGIGVGAAVILIGIRYVLGGATGGIHLPGLDRVTGWLTGHVDRLANGPGSSGSVRSTGCSRVRSSTRRTSTRSPAAPPSAGALALAALGVGTMPAVFLYGTVIESVDAVHRRRVHRLLGVAFVALGYVLFAHGLMAIGVHVPHPSLPFWNPIDIAGAGAANR